MMSDLISRQAAIETAHLPTIEDAGYEVIRLDDILALTSAQPEPQWIPCSERLPEAKEARYWVCSDTGHQFECRWTNRNRFWVGLTTDWHWNIFDVPQYSKAVAWMPLPEPYEGGNDGKI